MEPGVSASDSQAPGPGKPPSHVGRKRAQGLEEALRTIIINGLRTTTAILSPQELIWKADGTSILQMRKLEAQEFSSWPKAVLGELDWWSSSARLYIWDPVCAKGPEPATEAVRAEALRPCPITARGAHSYHSNGPSPPAVTAFTQVQVPGEGEPELVGTDP